MTSQNVDPEMGRREVPACQNQETGERFFATCGGLHYAAAQGNTAQIQKLVNNGADVNMIVKTVPPIYVAARCKQTSVIKLLLELKCDINAKTIEMELTALHTAVSTGAMEICKLLIDNGANINQRDHDGATPLMLAASVGVLEMLHFLIKSGADVNIPNKRGMTPVATAVQNGIATSVQLLLQNGAKLDITPDNKGNSELFHAVKGGQKDICAMLVNAGASVNNCNNNNEYPLSIAAMYGNSAITDILIEGGCKVNVLSRLGTPLYAAVERQHINVLRRLIEAGADVSYVTPNSRSPLTEALHQHTPSYDIILALLRAGSDIETAVCDCHDSPINMVSSRSSIPIVLLLCQADSKSGMISEAKMEELRVYCRFTYSYLVQYENTKVRALKALCRKSIKRSIGTVNYRKRVDKLHAPVHFKKYLLHEDVFLPDPKDMVCGDPFKIGSKYSKRVANPLIFSANGATTKL